MKDVQDHASESKTYREINTERMKKRNDMGRACIMYGKGERRGAYRILVGKPDRDHLEVPGIDGRIIQGDTKKWELLKNPTKIEEIQQKKLIDRN